VATVAGPGEALRALGELLAAVRLLQAEVTSSPTTPTTPPKGETP
jgi:hypothetical protein